MIDTVIEGATVYDGVRTTPDRADVGLVDGRIALIGALGEREAATRVDGRGLALAPGFIDVHSHSDELWLVDPRCEGKIAQGVTTEIGGNCGSSVAPLRGLAHERKREEAANYRLDADWRDLDEFFGLVERGGVALNVATLLGLGTVRRCVRGDREGRLDDGELRLETSLVREAIERGAIGVSSGLIYTPSRYADLDELTACAAAAGAAGAPRYVSHIRSEGDTLLEAVDEGLEVGRRAEVAVQFSHHKAAGKKNWGKVHRTLAMIERARERSGLAVNADVYPYTASWTDLATILPDDVRDGGREATLARLEDPPTASAIALRIELDWAGLWNDILITTVETERNAALAGMRIDEIAREWGLAPARAALRLLIEERLEPQAIFFTMNEDDVAAVLSAPFTCIGSDASARALAGPTARGVPHPRTFGCFPRVFGRFVRGRRTLEIGEAIRRMTSLPADIFGLRDRGRIEIGAFADLVLFDPEGIVDTATYEKPYAYPRGIDAVWVNGHAALRDGAPTGTLGGRVLRGGRSST
jgi:N-acyl-D-amino-acid deacylase